MHQVELESTHEIPAVKPRRSVRQFLAFALVFLLVIAAAGIHFTLERESSREAVAQRELTRVKLHRHELRRELQAGAGGLLALSRHPDLLAALGSSGQSLPAETRHAFGAAGRDGDAFTLMDKRRRVKLRLELTEGRVVTGDRRDAAPTLPEGFWKRGVQIWRPEDSAAAWFQLGVPLIDDLGRQRGALVLDWRRPASAAELKHRTQEFEAWLCILDVAADPRIFPLPGGGEAGATPASAPKLSRAQLQQLNSTHEGQFQDAGGLISFSSIEADLLNLDLAETASGGDSQNWRVMLRLPTEVLASEMNGIPLRLLPIYLPLLILLGLGLGFMGREFSRRHLTELALFDAQEARNRLLASVSDIVFSFQVAGRRIAASRIKDINSTGTILLGYGASDLSLLSVQGLVAAESLGSLEGMVQKLLSEHVAEPREIVVQARDGSRFTLMAMPRVLSESDPPIVQVWARDVSEIKLAMARIELAENAFVLQSSVIAALEAQEPLAGRLRRVLELLLEYVDVGPAGWVAAYHLDEEAARLRHIISRDGGGGEASDGADLPLDESEFCAGALSDRCLRLGSGSDEAEFFKRLGLDPTGHGLCALPLKAEGKVNGLLLLLAPDDEDWVEVRRDSLEQLSLRLGSGLAREEVADALGLQAESLRSELNAAESRLRGNAESNEQFMGSITEPLHDVLIRLSRVLEDTELDDEQTQVLKVAENTARVLHQRLSNVLDLNTFASGGFEFEERHFDPAATVRAVHEGFLWQAEKQGLALEVDLDDDLPPLLSGDPKRLQQILINLISNAFAYTKNGEIGIKAEMAKLEDDSAMLHFVVRDSGSGIPEDKQQQLYKLLSPAAGDQPSSTDEESVGLALCTHLVMGMHGRIWMQSTQGQGSSFHFMARFGLPGKKSKQSRGKQLEASSPRRPEPEASPVAQALLILVAEENERRLDHLQGLLGSRGHSIRQVVSGMEVIESIAQYEFDLLFISESLADLDGLTTAQAIREFETASGGHVPIILTTADAESVDIEAITVAGCDSSLGTPVREPELDALLRAWGQGNAKPETNRVDESSERKDVDMDVTVFDKNSALDRLGGDIELLIELAGMFLEDCPRMLEGLEVALDKSDSDSVQRLAHSLKGAVGNFSAHAAFEAAQVLEDAGREEDLSQGSSMYTQLKGEIERLLPALSSL